MKTSVKIILLAMASAASLSAAVTIDFLHHIPNGSNSGGTGSGGGSITAGFSTDRVLPTTTYTATGVNLVAVGGTANETFTFTVTYSATTDGSTPTSAIGYTGFGNIGVGGDFQLSGAETLTATINLTSSSFAQLSLNGFTSARAGGLGSGETGTFTWTGGGSYPLSNGDTIANNVTGNTFTLVAGASPSLISFEGFGAQFVAVPEPSSAALLGLGALALLRRRRA